MADELDNFITALTTVLGAVTGVEAAYENPPEALNEFPAVVPYFVRGDFSYGQSAPAIGLHTVHADLHISRSQLPTDEAAARPFILRFLIAIAGNLKMSATCDHCLLKSYSYGRLGYAGKETFGGRFVLEVKIKHSGITVSA